MRSFPETPSVADAPAELFERGHIWLHEWVDGAPVRLQLGADGRLRFGDDVRTFGVDVPAAYDHLARHVRERFDRAALRDAVDDVESVVFFGYAMHRRGVDYDWERTPNFLGSDVWSATAGDYLLPDRVEKIYARLGLDALATVAAEQRAADFDPETYTVPPSAWYDGPCVGVLVRNKRGHRARLDTPAVGDTPTSEGTVEPADSVDPDADDAGETFAHHHATTERFDAVARRLREAGRPVTFDALYERTIETIVRAQHHRLFGEAGDADVNVRAFRSAVAERTTAYLAARE